MLPPEVLQIHRERLKLGTEAAYAEVETRITRRCAELGSPHPYLGVESLTGPREVWFFNGYESEAEKASVADAYAGNAPLMEVLRALGQEKAAFLYEPFSSFARYRRVLTSGTPWAPGRGRFLVISVSRELRGGKGTVFEDDDGMRYVFGDYQTRNEAEQAAAGGVGNAFAVRPEWSYPAREWIAADPEFWHGHPATLGGNNT